MALTSATALRCLGFPTERLARLSAASGHPVWHPGDASGFIGARVIYLLGHAWEDQVAEVFAVPNSAWVEVGSLDDQAVLELIRRADDAEFFASFTTGTANRFDVSGVFLGAIASRRTLSDTCRENVELALHEALCNALLHGNLQMDGIGDLSVDALEQFSSNLMRRMSDPDFANRRIDVMCSFDEASVTFDVVDQGKGFTPKPKNKTEAKACGRGFELIAVSCQAFHLLDGGRRISMSFPL